MKTRPTRPLRRKRAPVKGAATRHAMKTRPTRPLRLVILGMMGRCPFGGQTWLYLNWLRAFARLGHDVWYVEDDTTWPYDPEKDTVTNDGHYATRHLATSLERIGLKDRWALRIVGEEGA